MLQMVQKSGDSKQVVLFAHHLQSVQTAPSTSEVMILAFTLLKVALDGQLQLTSNQ